MTALLVAGIGNIFQGDDGLGSRWRPSWHRAGCCRVCGSSISAFAASISFSHCSTPAARPFSSTPCSGEPPGTLYVIEPEAPGAEPAAETAPPSPHAMTPHEVLRLVSLMGGSCRRLLLVGCEPERFGEAEFGTMALTPPVAAAVARAADTVERLAREMLQQEVR